MGYAIAEELANQGADVFLVSGPVSLHTVHPNIQRIDVLSAQEMYDASLSKFPSCDVAIMCAAVADFTPVVVEDRKVKRGKENYTIELEPTKDIAAELGRQKRPNQKLVGFALETNDEVHNAHLKLSKKNLDFIVLNSMNDHGAGFKTDTNKISIIDHNNTLDFELKSKRDVATDIVNYLIETISVSNDF